MSRGVELKSARADVRQDRSTAAGGIRRDPRLVLIRLTISMLRLLGMWNLERFMSDLRLRPNMPVAEVRSMARQQLDKEPRSAHAGVTPSRT